MSNHSPFANLSPIAKILAIGTAIVSLSGSAYSAFQNNANTTSVAVLQSSQSTQDEQIKMLYGKIDCVENKATDIQVKQQRVLDLLEHMSARSRAHVVTIPGHGKVLVAYGDTAGGGG